MAYEYINKFKDDFEGITTIEMKNPIMYYIEESDIAYQIKLVRVFGDDTDSLYLHINEGESCTSITNIILRINDSENIPLQLIKRYNTGVKNDNQYQFTIPFEKFRDICQANKIIFKIKSERVGDYVFGNNGDDMLLDYCRIFYNQAYDADEFLNAISEYEANINTSVAYIVSSVLKDFLDRIIDSNGQINQEAIQFVKDKWRKNGVVNNRIFDELIASLEKKRWLRSYGLLPTFSQCLTDKAFILLVADTVCAVERELSKNLGWIIEDGDEPTITAEPRLRFEVPYLVTRPDMSLSVRYNISFRRTTFNKKEGVNIKIYILEVVRGGQSVTYSMKESNSILKDEIEQLARSFAETYSDKIMWLAKNLSYYEDLSRPLSDDSIYDGTLFDVLPSLKVRVGGEENVEEELVPAQQQPKRQVEQQNHNTNSRNNQSQHHSEEEKKTKIWPIILFIIAFLLWLFF